MGNEAKAQDKLGGMVVVVLGFVFGLFFFAVMKTCWLCLFICLFLFVLLFKCSCLHFTPTTVPCSSDPHLPPSILTPFGCVLGSFIRFLDAPSPSFPLYPPSPSPLVTVSLFFISVSLVIFCLLVCLLIRFYLQVRSHGICPSPPGLFHLA